MLSIKGIIILILVVSGAVGSFVQPIFGLIIIIILKHLNPELLTYNIQNVRFEFMLTIVLIFAAFINRTKLSNISVLRQPQYLLSIFLVLMLFLQSPFSEFSTTVAFSFSWNLLKIFIFCVLLIKIVDDERKLKWLIFSYIAGAFYIAFSVKYGTYMGYIGSQYHVLPEGSTETFHTALAVIIPTIVIYCIHGNKKEKIFAFVILVFTVNHMFVGGRRTPLIALAMMALMFIITKNPTRSKSKVALVSVLIIMSVYLCSDKIIKRYSITYDKVEQEVAISDPRMIIWSRALSVISLHPLGIGPGNFGLIHFTGYLEPDVLNEMVTHNTYLQVATDCGIPGLLLLLFILSFAYRSLRKVRILTIKQNRCSDISLIAWGLEIGLVAVTVDIFLRNRLYSDTWWWVIALSGVCLKIFNDKSTEAEIKTGSEDDVDFQIK